MLKIESDCCFCKYILSKVSALHKNKKGELKIEKTFIFTLCGYGNRIFCRRGVHTQRYGGKLYPDGKYGYSSRVHGGRNRGGYVA